MSLTRLVLKRPVAAIIIIFGLIVFGVMSIISLPQELTPDMELPILIVSTVYPGAGPQDVEKLVSRELEGAVGSLGGVKTVISTSSENVSVLVLTYNYGTNMDIAYTNLKEKLDGIAGRLPTDARKPVIVEMNINAIPVMSISVSSNNDRNLLYAVQEDLVPEFEKLAAVADVSVSGGRENYIKIELLEERMKQYGVAMSTITGSVSAANFSIPAGSLEYGSQSLTVRSSVEYRTLEAIRNIPIPLQSGGVIRLSDISNVFEAERAQDSVSRYNGKSNITINIQKRQSASAVATSKEVIAVLEDLRVLYPDITLDVIRDNSVIIVDSINSVAQTLVLSIFISMAVLYIFLGDLKASLIVGSSMPVSLLVAFILVDMMGFTLNIVTMSALVLGVGMMVDNSIVVLDSCFKSQTREKSFMDAALEGTKFVMLSIAASTLTTVVVFFPLATIQGISGQLFKPLGYTIIFSLTASLVSAITLAPMFFVQFKPRENRRAPVARLLKRTERAYGKLLRRLLKKKKTVFAVSMALLAISLWFATLLNVELMPSIDEGIISISVSVRPGLNLDSTNQIVSEIEAMVASHPDVKSYSLSAGSAGGYVLGGGSAAAGSVQAYLRDKPQMTTRQVVEQWRKQTAGIPNCNIEITTTSSTIMSMTSSGVEVTLRASSLAALKDASRQVEEIMKGHPDIISVSSTVENGNPQAEIVVDPMKAASVGLSPIQVASNVNVALGGVKTVSINKDNQIYDIRVEYPSGKYKTIADLQNMSVVGPTGDSIPLMNIAKIAFSDSPQSIRRENSQYVVTVTGVPVYEARFTAEKEITEQVKGLVFPQGVMQYNSTMVQMQNEEFMSLGKAIAIAVVLVFMVMAIQFESVKHSLMVMICIPFSLIGSFSLLYAADSTISMVSILGFLILVGTVVNNGILFVDTTNQYRNSMEVQTALVATGRNRLRPILMTTLTTVLSMIPLALGIGSGGEMMQGLGVVVIGGLTASTILTLLLLPTFYLMIDGNQEKKQKRRDKKEGKQRMKEEAKNPDMNESGLPV